MPMRSLYSLSEEGAGLAKSMRWPGCASALVIDGRVSRVVGVSLDEVVGAWEGEA